LLKSNSQEVLLVLFNYCNSQIFDLNKNRGIYQAETEKSYTKRSERGC
jgi:hypothetical protein